MDLLRYCDCAVSPLCCVLRGERHKDKMIVRIVPDLRWTPRCQPLEHRTQNHTQKVQQLFLPCRPPSSSRSPSRSGAPPALASASAAESATGALAPRLAVATTRRASGLARSPVACPSAKPHSSRLAEVSGTRACTMRAAAVLRRASGLAAAFMHISSPWSPLAPSGHSFPGPRHDVLAAFLLRQ